MAKMTIKRVGVLSFAKMQSLIMAFLGVFIGVIYGLIFMVVGAAMFSQRGGGAGAGASSLVIGVVMMIAVPIFYGVIGFIFGALSAFVYNVAAGFIGGIEMELENTEVEYAAPPPPQWGAGTSYQQGSSQPY
ncbi:MAG: hypothetical protein WCD76_08585 [Pyrinomonadaceae bacterium]